MTNLNNDFNIPVITLDGPSGSGKGTIGKRIAAHLHWHFLDSGALYRVLALAAVEQQVDPHNETKLADLASALNVNFNGGVYYLGQEVSDHIRTETCGHLASQIAVHPLVRQALLSKQRDFCKPPGLIADGRDMGTVVFPQANIKFFLEASVEERAQRRYLQLKDTDRSVTLQSLLEELSRRDERDKARVSSPLVPAKEAVVIDTTGMGIEEVLAKMLSLIEQRLY